MFQFCVASSQVRSEFRFQPLKVAHLRSHFNHLRGQQFPYRFARVYAAGPEVSQFSDFPEGEAECLHSLDETYALDVFRHIQPEATCGSHRSRKQSAFFIKANRIDRQLGSFCQLADL